MKFNFRKIASVVTSAVMLSSTAGFAAAATYPAPYVSSGSENSAVVVGSSASVAASDWAAAVTIQESLNAYVTTGDGSGTSVTGTAWQVETSSDSLELGESIYDVETYIGSDELPILADITMSNEKGTAKYEQFLYFEDTTSSMVTYQEDDDENVGLFFKVQSGETIARYVMDFTTNLESDITATGSLEDIKDEDITILGKTYAVTTATNGSSGVELTLMSGSSKATVTNDAESTIGGRAVSVMVSATNEAQFTVDGSTTNKLAEGDTYRMDDGSYLGVSDITYQNFAGGLMQATIYLGADKLEIKNGTSVSVNAESIGEANAIITHAESGGDISISEISINMTAEDDLYAAEDGKLSEATNLDEPEVLIGQNWDIEFKGLDTVEYETVDLRKSTDSKIKLDFENYNGNEISLPLIYTNVSGIYGGERAGYSLVLNATNSITKNDYFIVNTANPLSVGNDARTFVIQYKGADKVSDTNPKMKFTVLGVGDKEETLSSVGVSSMKLGGNTFAFVNTSTGTADDFSIKLTSTGYSTGTDTTGALSAYARTKYNGLINITDLNSNATAVAGYASNWVVSLKEDDTDRDGDDLPVTTAITDFSFTYSNNSDGEFGTSVTTSTNGTSWTSDPSDNTKSTYVTNHGTMIDYDNPSSAPSSITVKIPESAVTPLIYVSSGEISITPGAAGAGAQVAIVNDNEASSLTDKNLIVVGGSCINTVAAELLGSTTPLCGADFTDATGVNAGGYVIQVFANPYSIADSGNVAMLVAGYEAAQTTSAANDVVDGFDDADVIGTKVTSPVVGTA